MIYQAITTKMIFWFGYSIPLDLFASLLMNLLFTSLLNIHLLLFRMIYHEIFLINHSFKTISLSLMIIETDCPLHGFSYYMNYFHSTILNLPVKNSYLD